MAKINQLTARQVATLTKPGLYGDGQRLYLQVTGSGAKSWVFRFNFEGKTYSMGLGPASVFPLAEARKRALDASVLLFSGINPLEQKRAKQTVQHVAEKSKPFEWCARQYITAHQAGWKGKREVYNWVHPLEAYAYPFIGKMAVREIATADIKRVLDPIWYTKTHTASKLRLRMERILSWAAAEGLRDEKNPAAWDILQHSYPSETKVRDVQHRPSLPWTEVGEFVRALQTDSAVPARALELLILTALRSEEVLGARWGEFDLANKIWTVPASRMKSRKKHEVPLSSAALKLLNNILIVAGNPYVFVGGSNGRLTPGAMQDKIRQTNEVITVHGFRATFTGWAANRTNFPKEVREMALAHAVGSAVEAAYQRTELLDKRRALMQAWGEFVTRPPAEVVPLRA